MLLKLAAEEAKSEKKDDPSKQDTAPSAWKKAWNYGATAGGAVVGGGVGARLGAGIADKALSNAIWDKASTYATRKASRLIPGVRAAAPRNNLSNALRDYLNSIRDARPSDYYGAARSDDLYNIGRAANDLKEASSSFMVDGRKAPPPALQQMLNRRAKLSSVKRGLLDYFRDKIVSDPRMLAKINARARVGKAVGGVLGTLGLGTGMYYLTKPETRAAIAKAIDKPEKSDK